MDADSLTEPPVVNVALERLRVQHADEMVSVLADRSLYDFTGGEPPSRDALADRYRSQVRGSGRPEVRWCNWIIRRRDSNEAIGFVQATIVDGVADIAWLVGLRHQGSGFAVQAVEAMIDELAALDVTGLDAHIHPDHDRSESVATRIGLKRTGELDADGEEIWTNLPRHAASTRDADDTTRTSIGPDRRGAAAGNAAPASP